jgi:RNA polymerase sigma-70 factor (ECF subfamily)
MSQSDAELLRAVWAGEQPAFEAIHRRYFHALYRFAVSLSRDPSSASDIVQETFLRFWRARERIRSEQVLRVLLFRITRNAALNAGRGVRRRERVEQQSEPELSTATDSAIPVDVSLEMAEEEARVRLAIQNLPVRAREAIVLRWVHGLSYNEIAQAMDVSPETVKSQLARALLLLRERL